MLKRRVIAIMKLKNGMLAAAPIIAETETEPEAGQG
jgi:hypothetical protein